MFDLGALDFQQFTHFHLLRPWWLLILLPLLLSLWFLWAAKDPMSRWKQSVAPHLLKAMLVRHSGSSWFNPISMSVLLVLLGALALTGPTWKQQASPFSKDIAPLVVILDASASMDQIDVQPSRLERAKHKIQDLMDLRPGGRIGLIVFAGTAHSVIPLSDDPDVVKNFLNAVSTNMMPRPGKFPEKALPLADKMFEDSPVPGTILLLGDGVSPLTPEAFKQYFSVQTHQLLILGMGRDAEQTGSDTEPAVVSDVAVTPLEKQALKQLAADSGGYYQELMLDRSDVNKLNSRINNYLVISDDGNLPWLDAGYYLLYPLALLYLLWFRKGWTLHWCLASLFVGMVTVPPPAFAQSLDSSRWHFSDLWMTPNQQGRYYLSKGDFKTAAQRFSDISWRGVAYYRDENFAAAVEMFSRVETADGYFNLGNALAHGRNYVKAVQAYEKTLKLEPAHAGALKNMAFIQSIIDEINQMSASQQSEGGTDTSKELGEDDPQTADVGAEVIEFGGQEQQQLTAEQILLDEEMNETWMRQVQKDPARFLQVKFQMQLQQGE